MFYIVRQTVPSRHSRHEPTAWFTALQVNESPVIPVKVAKAVPSGVAPGVTLKVETYEDRNDDIKVNGCN